MQQYFYILLSTMCFVYVFPRPFLHWSTNIRTNYQTIQGLDFKVNFDKVLRSHETLDKIFSPLPEPLGVPSIIRCYIFKKKTHFFRDFKGSELLLHICIT